MTSKWRQKAACCRLWSRWPRKPGDKVVLYLVSGPKKSYGNGETSLRTAWKYFGWIIKQLLNLAFVEEILQISEGVIHLGLRPLWIAPSLICKKKQRRSNQFELGRWISALKILFCCCCCSLRLTFKCNVFVWFGLYRKYKEETKGFQKRLPKACMSFWTLPIPTGYKLKFSLHTHAHGI